ncbi:hypothetical protein [Demequina iriomotensis]|uniref:hypothetical protein n=1 Tax=Demequina iriomotensis TaxID=1536641 RepID=UPI000780D4F7|nr:hypothetical protein [Demequina iriomotensis]
MRTTYRALTLLLVAFAAVQVAALAWFMGGAITWTDGGGTLTRDLMWGDAVPFIEVHGLDIAWFVGSVMVPCAALATVVVALAWRNELAILASLAILGLAFAEAFVLRGVVTGLAAPALQGAAVVAIAALAAVAPKGAAWATRNRDKVRAVYAHTPLAA